MARSMSKGRTVGRPAQGHNSIVKTGGKTAYKADAAPVIKSRGSVSHPNDTGNWRLKRLVADETPRTVQG